MNDLSCEQNFFPFVTIPAFDGETDGQTDIFLMAIPCVALHVVAR